MFVCYYLRYLFFFKYILQNKSEDQLIEAFNNNPYIRAYYMYLDELENEEEDDDGYYTENSIFEDEEDEEYQHQ